MLVIKLYQNGTEKLKKIYYTYTQKISLIFVYDSLSKTKIPKFNCFHIHHPSEFRNEKIGSLKHKIIQNDLYDLQIVNKKHRIYVPYATAFISAQLKIIA